MALIVVESPTKARTFNRILKAKSLDEQYFVFATVGHFRDLPSSKMSVDMKHDFKPDYQIMPKKEKMVNTLQELAKSHKKIILATDLDREGESISYHVAFILGYIDENWPDFRIKNGSNLERIVFHEITPSALVDALAHPENLRNNLVKAQQTRRILDRIVGYELSPLLWSKMGKNWLSAGRVQTVALRLIVEREKEILKFGTEKYFQVIGLFNKLGELKSKLISYKNEIFEIKTKIDLFEGSYEYAKTTIDKERSDRIQADLKKDKFQILSVEKKSAVRYPPPPFTTSLLQQESFRKLGFPSRLTMRIAQSLYEKGLITYHRTDSFSLSSKYVFKAKDYIIKAYGKQYALDKPRGYKTRSKNAQEAHEAIRPTKADAPLSSLKRKLTPQEKKLYDLIFIRALATQMKEAEVHETKIIITSDKSYNFEAGHIQVVFEGFFKVLSPNYGKKNSFALQLSVKDPISLVELEVEEKETKPPYRYSEGSLIKVLEEKGIGRPSTYASIISLVIDKHYVEKEYRYLKPTALGTSISDYLSESFPSLFDLNFTAEMEDSLDQIANGQKTTLELLRNFYQPFEKEVKIMKKDKEKIDVAEDILEEKCPKCKSDLIARFGKYGKFYACRGYPKCKYIKANLHFVKNSVCLECQGRLVVRFSKKGRRFYGCENYPKCKHIQWTLQGSIKNDKIEVTKIDNPKSVEKS